MSSHLLLEELPLEVLPAGSWIVEIGSQREPLPADDPANSSAWLLRLAERLGLGFATVDFSKATHELAGTYVGEHAHLSDGAAFLEAFDRPVSVLYLDNFDVVYNDRHRESLLRRVGTAYDDAHEDLTNERSAEVHLGQVVAAERLLTSPAYVGLDDTMVRDGEWWGKGATAVPYLLSKGWGIVARGDEGLFLAKPAEE